MKYDLALNNGQIFYQNKLQDLHLGISGGQVAKISTSPLDAHEIRNIKGLQVLPGIIDTQVHFREPGLEHKETLETGTRGALLGGVTAVFEMPNTKPSTTTREALQDKITRMQNRAWIDYAFYIGAVQSNLEQLAEIEQMPGCCGIKVFMGSSTGDLLLYKDADLEKLLQLTRGNIALHCEDEDRMIERKHLALEAKDPKAHPIWRDETSAFMATHKIVELAKRLGRRVHILHVTSAREMEYLAKNKAHCSVEVTPQHLTFWAPDCYEKYGTLVQMNPPIRSREHFEAIWKGLREGIVDVIGTDHAPHTLNEKRKPYPESPSGIPGVQTVVPLMLNYVNEGKLSLADFVRLMVLNPIRIFGITSRSEIRQGASADFTIIDMQKTARVEDSWLVSKAGYSPYSGWKLKGWPVGVILRGETALWDAQIVGRSKGTTLQFTHRKSE